jgi:transketolase
MKTSPTVTKAPPINRTRLDQRSLALRRQIILALAAGQRGHVASAFSLVEILRVLYDDVLRYDARDPRCADRDRCILSKGHGCLALYVVLAEKGFFPEEELWRFCKSDGILGGHPEFGKVPGVEASTGSLGHGLPIGVGMALCARMDGAKHRIFVVGSDGECDEGSVWEAALCAAKHHLSNLVLLLDYNKQQSYSTTYEVLDLDPLGDKWRAFGFAVEEVDGHDVAALGEALGRTPFQDDRPSLIICHTIKGKGIPLLENNAKWHHKTKVSDDELRTLLQALEGPSCEKPV